MTDKELRGLSRAELYELLLIERLEIDRLKTECEKLRLVVAGLSENARNNRPEQAAPISAAVEPTREQASEAAESAASYQASDIPEQPDAVEPELSAVEPQFSETQVNDLPEYEAQEVQKQIIEPEIIEPKPTEQQFAAAAPGQFEWPAAEQTAAEPAAQAQFEDVSNGRDIEQEVPLEEPAPEPESAEEQIAEPETQAVEKAKQHAQAQPQRNTEAKPAAKLVIPAPKRQSVKVKVLRNETKQKGRGRK